MSEARKLAEQVAKTLTELRILVDRSTDVLFDEVEDDGVEDDVDWDDHPANYIRESALSGEQLLFDSCEYLEENGLNVVFSRDTGEFVVKEIE